MKLGFVSRTGEFPEREWEKEFEIAKQYNLSHLELIINYPFLGPLTCTRKQMNYLRDLSEKNRIELILHLLPNQYGLSREQILKMGAVSADVNAFLKHEAQLKQGKFNIASLDENVRKFSVEEIKRTIKIARELGTKLITIHGGSFPANEDYQQYLQIAKRTLGELNAEFKDVKLAIENLPTLGHFGNPPNELPIYANDLIYLVKGLDNVGICFDIGHANTFGNPVSYYEKIRKSKKIWNIHLHDNKGDKDDHFQLGEGNIDFKKFFEQLRRDEYSGYLSIELDTWPEPPKPMTAYERINALSYLKKIID